LPQSADYDRSPLADGTPPEDGTVASGSLTSDDRVSAPPAPDDLFERVPDVPADTARSPEHSRSGMLWWLSAAVVAVDQISKAIVHAKLAPFDSVTIIPGLLDFIHVQNAGVAFGFLNDAGMNHQLRSILTTALAALALVGIAFYARHVHRHERLARVGLALILGGAVGNLIDRLRVGYVLDYVDVYWRGWHFWAFNVADASITIGALLVFADLLLVTRHASHPAQDR
jgi:signal peptidase II